MGHRSRAAGVAGLLLVSLQAWAADGGTHPLAGTWKLDAEATSDPAPVLVHYDANVFVKRFARSVSPTNVIAWSGDRFTLEVRALAITRKTSIVLDGTTPTADDIFGNPYLYTSTLEDGAVVSRGFVERTNGTKDALAMRRSVEADGRMVLSMTITTAEGKTLEVKRVFNRVAPASPK